MRIFIKSLRILTNVFAYKDLWGSFNNLLKILERSYSLRIFGRSLTILEDPQRSCEVFSPGTIRDSWLLKTMQCESNFEILELWFISLWKRKERTKNNFREFFWQFRLPLSRGAFFPQIFSEQSDRVVHLTYDNIFYLCIYLSNLTNLFKFWTFYSMP